MVELGFRDFVFFFWEQSFGRITGENVWKDDSSYFFFTHNYLWEFLPWSLIGLMAFWEKIKIIVKGRFKPNASIELFTFGGFILPFIALSTSQYKLPHYIMVIMPLAAVFTGAYIDNLLKQTKSKAFKSFKWIQFTFAILIGFLVLFILSWVFPDTNPGWWLIPLFIFGLSVYFISKLNPVVRLMAPSLVAVILTNVMMNGYFYPQLNQYQTGKLLADWAVENNIQSDQLVMFKKHYFNSYFYSGQNYMSVNTAHLKELISSNNIYVFTHEGGLKDLKKNEITYQIKERLYNFPNSELTTEF